MSAAGTATDD